LGGAWLGIIVLLNLGNIHAGFCILLLFVVLIVIGLIGNNKDAKEAKSILDKLIIDEANINNRLELTNNILLYGLSITDIVELIPVEYQNPFALNAMARYIHNMEASNWADCIKIWKNETHYSKIEEEAKKTREFAEKAAINTVKPKWKLF